MMNFFFLLHLYSSHTLVERVIQGTYTREINLGAIWEFCQLKPTLWHLQLAFLLQTKYVHPFPRSPVLFNIIASARASLWRRQWHPLQYSCLENPMDGGTWKAAVHGVAEGRTLSNFTFMHWRRQWQPTPVFLHGKSHRCTSLAGYSPWGRTESDMTEWLHFL